MSRTFFHKRRAAGFSLVEVLIAVLVLSLGLLGLGAVFPMVMRQQRIATQTTLGLSAQRAAEQMLFSRVDFSRDGGIGWEDMRTYVIDNAVDIGDWVTIIPEGDNDVFLGGYVLPDRTAFTTVIPLSQRLYPAPYSTDGEPRFVWDLAARTTARLANQEADSALQVVMFLRPIDPAIKPARGNDGQYSITSSLVDSQNVAMRDRRIPVAVDRDGRPTQDGRRDQGRQYALPIIAEAAPGPGNGNTDPSLSMQIFRVVQPDYLDELEIAQDLLFRQGQVFVDRNGIVRTVESIVTEPIGGGSQTISYIDRVSPPFVDVDGNGTIDGEDYSPVLFLPQTPVVEPVVFTIQP